MSRRRELTMVAAIIFAGAALALFAASRQWLVVTVDQPGLPRAADVASGAALAPLVPAASLASLAALGAVFATRARARSVLGVLLVALGAGVVVAAARVRTPDAGFAWFAYVPVGEARLTGRLWWLAAGAGGVLQAIGGVWVVLRGNGLPAPGRRSVGPPPSSPGRAGMWDALDRGEDPTA